MALSKEKLKSMLDNEETDYNLILKSLGKENLEHLHEFAKSRDLMLAQKAIYAASLMKDGIGLPVLEAAASSRVAVKKIAAASGLKNLQSSEGKLKLAERLIGTRDVSVQKLVLNSISKAEKVSPKLKLQIEALSKRRGSKLIQDLSKKALNKIK